MPSPIPASSEDYSDIIVKKQLLPVRIEERYQEQPVDRQYSILYAPLSENLYAAHQIGYISVPKLYTFISLSSLERSGILSAQNSSVTPLEASRIRSSSSADSAARLSLP